MQKICINFIIYAGGTVSSLINVIQFLVGFRWSRTTGGRIKYAFFSRFKEDG